MEGWKRRLGTASEEYSVFPNEPNLEDEALYTENYNIITVNPAPIDWNT